MSREAIEEAGRGEDITFFDRSGFTRSPGIATLFWLGDQMQTWDEYDGIKTAVVGLLSGGVSGFSLLPQRHRRLRGGEGERRRAADPGDRADAGAPHALDGAQRLHRGLPHPRGPRSGGGGAVRHRRGDARAHAALRPGLQRARGYRKGLVAEAAATGAPVVRHLFLHYPDDPNVKGLRYQFLLGPDLMVAPVLTRGAAEVEVYFPEGEAWTDLWTGAEAGRPGEWVADAGAAGAPGRLPAQGRASRRGDPGRAPRCRRARR